jgi:hypothetical protein
MVHRFVYTWGPRKFIRFWLTIPDTDPPLRIDEHTISAAWWSRGPKVLKTDRESFADLL